MYYEIQGYNETLKQWFLCYKIKSYSDAIDHVKYMEKEYFFKIRIIKKDLTK